MEPVKKAKAGLFTGAGITIGNILWHVAKSIEWVRENIVWVVGDLETVRDIVGARSRIIAMGWRILFGWWLGPIITAISVYFYWRLRDQPTSATRQPVGHDDLQNQNHDELSGKVAESRDGAPVPIFDYPAGKDPNGPVNTVVVRNASDTDVFRFKVEPIHLGNDNVLTTQGGEISIPAHQEGRILIGRQQFTRSALAALGPQTVDIIEAVQVASVVATYKKARAGQNATVNSWPIVITFEDSAGNAFTARWEIQHDLSTFRVRIVASGNAVPIDPRTDETWPLRGATGSVIDKIGFDYVGGSPTGRPLDEGWTKAYGEGDPEFYVARDPDGTYGMEMTADPGYAMEYWLRPATAVGTSRVRLSIRYSQTTMFFLLFRLVSKTDSSRTLKRQLKVLLEGGGRRTPEQHPEVTQEKIAWVPTTPLGDGWVKLNLNLVDLIDDAWGAQGLALDALEGIRLRGDVAVSPIELLSSQLLVGQRGATD